MTLEEKLNANGEALSLPGPWNCYANTMYEQPKILFNKSLLLITGGVITFHPSGVSLLHGLALKACGIIWGFKAMYLCLQDT